MTQIPALSGRVPGRVYTSTAPLKPWFQGVSAGVASDEAGKGGGREVRISFPVLGPDQHGKLLTEGFREKLVVFVS